MELERFLELPVNDVVRSVRANGPLVCVFPINGTRRWFALEYGQEKWDDPVTAYMDMAGKNHIALFRLFFDHGIDTLLTPVFGSELLLRGEEYMRRVGMDGLRRLAEDPSFLSFYDEYEVRVHFYGDHRRILGGTEFAHLSDLFDAASEKTSGHKRFRLFFGVFSSDATQAVAEFSAQYFQRNGRVPQRHSYAGSCLTKSILGGPPSPTMQICQGRNWTIYAIFMQSIMGILWAPVPFSMEYGSRSSSSWGNPSKFTITEQYGLVIGHSLFSEGLGLS